MKSFFFETYVGGILFILIGVLIIIHTVKYTNPVYDSVLQPYTHGILGGIGAIILGFSIIVNIFLGNI